MSGKAVISLTTGLEDTEKVTVAFLVSVGAVGLLRHLCVDVLDSTVEVLNVELPRCGHRCPLLVSAHCCPCGVFGVSS